MSSCHKKGFGLVETLVATAIFLLIATSSYNGFLKVIDAVKVLRVKNASVNLANEQIEIIRNLPYSDVGIIAGIPAGKIPREQQIERSGILFDVVTTIRNVDDPFDGTIGGTPNDLSPADYKVVQISIKCNNCNYTEEMSFYSRVAPLALESDSNNGALFVQVFDANGQPLSGADVFIFNDQGTTTISINETTNNDGMFQLVDAPPGTGAYQITASKGDDYSTDKTYEIGSPENPSPNIPHANVSAGQVTQVSFAIDKLSDLDIFTRQNTCEIIGNVDFNIFGSKTIGDGVLKYSSTKTTNSSGFLAIDGLEWDNYGIDIIGSSWHFAGSSLFLPIELNPGSDKALDLILAPREPRALLVKVVDGSTSLPVSGATVTLDGPGGEREFITERGFFVQTDWSSGQGQEYFESDNSAYFSSSNLNINNPVGQISLADFAGSYYSSGFLESSIFDTGTTTNFGNLFWSPGDQPVLAGEDSVKIQIASNLEVTATSTWEFVGPDGTAGSFYTTPGQSIASVHGGDRFLKYKIFLETEDNSATPIVSSVSITFMQECLPPGQAFFSGLGGGSYTLSIGHPNYQNFNTPIDISDDWAEYEAVLSP